MDGDDVTTKAEAAEAVTQAAAAQDEMVTEAAPVNGLGALIDRWFDDHFPGSVVARDVEAWNLVHRAKEELKARLSKR